MRKSLQEMLNTTTRGGRNKNAEEDMGINDAVDIESIELGNWWT